MGEGLNFKVPIAEMSSRWMSRFNPSVQGDRCLFKRISDGENDRDDELSYRSIFVNDLYQKVGLDFADKVIDPAFNDFVKEVVPTYPIGEILPKREEIRQRP